jgi:hypothetical protein
MFMTASVQADVQKQEAAPKKADGNEWVTWDDTRKMSFVEGFLAGSFYMIEEGVTLTRGYSEDKLNEMSVKMDLERDNPVFTGADLASWSDMEKEYLVKERNRTLMKYLVHGVSNAQLKDGLDALYADPAVRHSHIRRDLPREDEDLPCRAGRDKQRPPVPDGGQEKPQPSQDRERKR